MFISNHYGVLCALFFPSLSQTNSVADSQNAQFMTVDDISYVIVYRDNEKFYLEECEERFQQNANTEPDRTLIVYTNKQRIISKEDVIIEIKQFDKISKEHKFENSEESPS